MREFSPLVVNQRHPCPLLSSFHLTPNIPNLAFQPLLKIFVKYCLSWKFHLANCDSYSKLRKYFWQATKDFSWKEESTLEEKESYRENRDRFLDSDFWSCFLHLSVGPQLHSWLKHRKQETISSRENVSQLKVPNDSNKSLSQKWNSNMVLDGTL